MRPATRRGEREGTPASRHTMDRRAKRLQRKLKAKADANAAASSNDDSGSLPAAKGVASADEKVARLLAEDEDVLLNFLADLNKLYQDQLDRPAPFVSFVICGMQSSGKSTTVERFLNAPLNIVQEGTGKSFSFDASLDVGNQLMFL